jgi:hypothetical protein
MILTSHPELLDLSGELVARCPHAIGLASTIATAAQRSQLDIVVRESLSPRVMTGVRR